MPKNSRPEFGSNLYEGYSLGQMKEAQNAYDLLEAQEKQNELLREQNRLIQQEREQEEINKLQEQIKAIERDVWNKVVNDFAKIGMEARDVSAFTSLIIQGPKYKRIEELTEELKKLKKEHIALKSKEDWYDTEKYLNKIKKYEEDLRKCKRGLFASKEDKEKYSKIKKKLDDLKFTFYEVIQYENPNESDKKKKLKEVKVRLPKNEEETKKIKEELEEIQKYNNTKKEEIRQAFNEFRKNHYNKEVEFIFKDNGFGIDYIKPSEAVKEGTVEDYKNYMRETLINVKLED